MGVILRGSSSPGVHRLSAAPLLGGEGQDLPPDLRWRPAWV